MPSGSVISGNLVPSVAEFTSDRARLLLLSDDMVLREFGGSAML